MSILHELVTTQCLMSAVYLQTLLIIQNVINYLEYSYILIDNYGINYVLIN